MSDESYLYAHTVDVTSVNAYNLNTGKVKGKPRFVTSMFAYAVYIVAAFFHNVVDGLVLIQEQIKD